MRTIVDAIGRRRFCIPGVPRRIRETTDRRDRRGNRRLHGQRLENVAAGKSTASLERTVKNILRESAIDLMARAGFLPRYAFPLRCRPPFQTEDSE